MLHCFKITKVIFTLWIVFWIWLDPSRWNELRNNNTCVLSVLHSQYHACWCSGDFRRQGFSRYGIDPQSWNILSLASEELTHWGRVTHICFGNLTIIGSDNGLSPGRRQAIIWTNARILLIGPLGTNFSEMFIEIHTFSFKKMHVKMLSAKRRRFCHGLNVLMKYQSCWWPGNVRSQGISRYGISLVCTEHAVG